MNPGPSSPQNHSDGPALAEARERTAELDRLILQGQMVEGRGLVDDVKELIDVIELAWALLSFVDAGTWSNQQPEWIEMVEDFRDRVLRDLLRGS